MTRSLAYRIFQPPPALQDGLTAQQTRIARAETEALAAALAHPRRCGPGRAEAPRVPSSGLKGSVAERPYHSNSSVQNSVGIQERILQEFRNCEEFCLFQDCRRNSDRISSESVTIR